LEDALKKFKDRLRITAILYTFSKSSTTENGKPVSEFRTEIKIQAIDFLLRYPDFLSCELLSLLKENSPPEREAIEEIVHQIFNNREPELRTEDMKKFFFGAYASLDDVILFLLQVKFITFHSKRRRDGKNYDKLYSLTEFGKEKIDKSLKDIQATSWYFERCQLIKHYFGHFSGTELKKRQYRYKEAYADIPYGKTIRNIKQQVRDLYMEEFKKELI
jgi:hypothetical protein